MHIKKRTLLLKIFALCLALILAVPTYANASEIETVQPRASYYIDSYQTYVYPAGSGKVQVWFDVTGTTYMDDIGALSIYLYESKDNSTWTYIKTFNHSSYSDMLAHNEFVHMSHVDYQGVAGRYYKAYVCIWAGKDGGGDTRYLWTSAKKAT